MEKTERVKNSWYPPLCAVIWIVGDGNCRLQLRIVECAILARINCSPLSA
jgi:hypothetical protein